MKYVLALLAVLILAQCASAQNVTVIGPITPGDVPQFNSPTVIKDSGLAASALPIGFANPTATVSSTVVNGSANTAMRSDAAPALATNGVTNANLAQMLANTVKCNPTGSTANAQDCTAPTVSGTITSLLTGGGTGSAFLASAASPTYAWQATGQGADQKVWDANVQGLTLNFRMVNDANNAANPWMTVTRGTGTAISSILMGNGAADSGTGRATTGNLLNVFDGKTAGPTVTSINPSVYIYRVESVNSVFNDYTAALEVGNTGIGVTGGFQTQGIQARVSKDGTSTKDVVAINGIAYNFETGVNAGTAFGAFFDAENWGPTNSVGLQLHTAQGSGTNYSYNPTPGSAQQSIGIDINYVGTANGSTSALGSVALDVRAGNNQWDVGIGFMNGSPIKTAEIQSDTNAITMYKANTGSHTNGIDLSAVTFSGSAFKSPGFSVSGVGFLAVTVNQVGSVTTITNSHATAGDTGMLVQAGATSATNDTTTYFVGYNDTTGTNLGGVRRNGVGAVTYLTTSDERLKLDRGISSRGLADLMKIEVHDYSFKSNLDHTVEGFFAQQLHSIYPEAVAVGGDDPRREPWGVDYGRMTPLIIKSIQDMQDEIIELRASAKRCSFEHEARMKELEDKIAK